MINILRHQLLRFFTEPLLHFMILGAAIFVGFNVMSGRTPNEKNAIVVRQATIQNLASVFTRSWQRSPSEEELNELIQDYIREEVAVREALALGIDRDDSIIRRLLRQKLEFVTEDVALQAEPTDEDLRTYLHGHADVFTSEPRFSFTQIYFNAQHRGTRLGQDAAKLREHLNTSKVPVDVATQGDITSLEHQFNALPASQIKQLFGEPFATALATLEPGQWSGPVASGYGQHLIFVSEQLPGSLPNLEQVREAVRRDWANSRRIDALDKFYATRLHNYSVTIEIPLPKSADNNVAELSR